MQRRAYFSVHPALQQLKTPHERQVNLVPKSETRRGLMTECIMELHCIHIKWVCISIRSLLSLTVRVLNAGINAEISL